MEFKAMWSVTNLKRTQPNITITSTFKAYALAKIVQNSVESVEYFNISKKWKFSRIDFSL